MKAPVLVVDDDPDMLDLLRLSLTQAGYVVETAPSGRDAFTKARLLVPGLIILDIVIPDVNGFTICEDLRRDRLTAAIPILLVTALPGDFPRMVGLEVGADACLRKPFQMEELLAQVRAIYGATHPLRAANRPLLSRGERTSTVLDERPNPGTPP